MNTKASEEKLVRQAQAGNQHAFGQLYSQYSRLIYSIVRHMVRNDEAAADLTQETFIRAWRNLPRLDEPKAFGGWLRTIALNQSRDWRRSHRPTESLDNDDEDSAEKQWADESDGPAEQLVTSEQQQEIRDAIDRLGDEQRIVVLMHHLEGIPVAEIAAQLGIPLGTVLSRLARGRDALKRKLRPLVDSG